MTYKDWWQKSQRIERALKMKRYLRFSLLSFVRPRHQLKRPIWGFLFKGVVWIFLGTAAVILTIDLLIYLLR